MRNAIDSASFIAFYHTIALEHSNGISKPEYIYPWESAKCIYTFYINTYYVVSWSSNWASDRKFYHEKGWPTLNNINT